MGSCFGKEQSSMSTRSVDDNDVNIWPTKKPNYLAKNLTRSTPLPAWVSRGMPSNPPEFTPLHKHIVSETWVNLRGSMVSIGMAVFRNLAEALPPVKELLRSKNKDKSLMELVLYHGELVMGSVGKAVMYLNDPVQMQNFLHEVGERHAEVDVRAEYMDCFIPFFIAALRPKLRGKWASNIEDAWAAFFRFIIHFIKEAMIF